MLNLLGPCHLALSTTLTFGVWTRLFHEQVRALWDFTATSDNEISLEEDDVITLTGVIDGGWWEGDLNGVVGFFPANYVEVVQSDEAVRAYAPRARAEHAPPARRSHAPSFAGAVPQYDYSTARQTMMHMQEQIGLSDVKDKGISAERNRTWYITYKQQEAVKAGRARPCTDAPAAMLTASHFLHPSV